MDARPSPTPSEDNAANTRDTSMYAAIDGAMSQQAQSYDDFLKGFSHLKKDNNALTKPSNIDSSPMHDESDFSKRMHASKNKSKPKIRMDVQPLSIARRPENPTNVEIFANQSAAEQREVNQSAVTGSSKVPEMEELEEVELGTGELCSRLAAGAGPQRGVDMKFDNFVEIHSDSDGGVDVDDDFESNYTASFCNSESKVRDGMKKKTQETKDTAKPNVEMRSKDQDEMKKEAKCKNSDADVIKTLDNSVNLLENENTTKTSLSKITSVIEDDSKQLGSQATNAGTNNAGTSSGMTTDDLLMSFMADLQAELLGESNNTCTDKTSLQKPKAAVTDTENEEQKSVNAAEDNELNDKETYDIESTQIETDVKSEINKMVGKTKLNEIPDPSVQKKSEGIDSNDTTEDIEDNLIANLEEAQQSNVLFPGEVENSECDEGVKHERLLDFTVTYKSNTTTCNGATEECSNEVEPFSLDTGFDYDNVVLAPKFSSEDLHQIQQLKVEQVGM